MTQRTDMFQSVADSLQTPEDKVYLNDTLMKATGKEVMLGDLSEAKGEFSDAELAEFRSSMDSTVARHVRLGNIGKYEQMLSNQHFDPEIAELGEAALLTEQDLAHVDKVLGPEGKASEVRYTQLPELAFESDAFEHN